MNFGLFPKKSWFLRLHRLILYLPFWLVFCSAELLSQTPTKFCFNTLGSLFCLFQPFQILSLNKFQKLWNQDAQSQEPCTSPALTFSVRLCIIVTKHLMGSWCFSSVSEALSLCSECVWIKSWRQRSVEENVSMLQETGDSAQSTLRTRHFL